MYSVFFSRIKIINGRGKSCNCDVSGFSVVSLYLGSRTASHDSISGLFLEL